MSERDDLQLFADKIGAPLGVAAYQFLRGGGSVGLSDWAGLSVASSSALSAAGHRLRVELAAKIGQAAESENGRATVMAEIDGGDQLRTRAVASLIDSVEEAINGRNG